MGVLLRKEEEGVMGGVTGGVRLPLVWRGGVAVLFLDTPPPAMDRDSLGVAFFFRVSCSRRAASVMNLQTGEGTGGRPGGRVSPQGFITRSWVQMMRSQHGHDNIIMLYYNVVQ